MTPERFQLISQIYHGALECDPPQRVAFLERQCGKDQDLLHEVESLLSGGKRAEALLLSMAMKEAVRRLTDETAPSIVGLTLDHYEILALVGAGGMGEVYRARDINLGRDVAIKLLPGSFSSDAERRRFEREARAASSLNHPNILTIHEIEQVDEHRFLVAEYIDGETLRQRLGRGRMQLSEALDIAIQIASALAAAHAAGIVHRDIKPENIMLRRDDLVKVLDFGLAKLTESSSRADNPNQSTLEWFNTDPGIVLGTSAYMSPEQTRGLAVDARSDIWSLGVVLYEMVNGSPPFTGATKSDVIVSILEKEPPELKDVATDHTKALKWIFDKALKKIPDQRYQTARDLLDDLRMLRQELGTRTTSASFNKFGLPSRVPFSTRAIKVALLSGIVVVLAIALYKVIERKPTESARPAARTVPFTTFPGREQQPTFSPDGKQIAFSWNGDKGNNFDIYIKLVNSEARPLQLTSNPADDIYPAWSPDGQQIAFVRHVGPEIGIFTISALGGPERKLYSGTSAFYSLYEFGNALSWTPDGKYLAFSGQPAPKQPNGIFLLSMETLQARQLTTPPEGFLGDSTPAFSPDGKLLAFVRGASSRDVELYVMPAQGGEPKRLTFDNRSSRSLAWTADSRWIVFSSWFYGGLKLFKIPAAGGTPEQLEVGTEFASTLAISRQGDRLAYSQEFRDTNIWRIDLRGATTKSNHIKLISSTRQDYSPQYSFDSKKIAFTSGRTGSNEIWVCDADGQNPVPITSFDGPDVGSPRWSPDGEQIAFDCLAPGHRDIYLVGVQGGKPRRLTGDDFDNVRPSWSRDGRWIYFGSNRTGDWQLWKAPAEGGQPVQLTKQGGREGFESVDGKFVYYTKGFGLAGIWKVSTEGGDETFVLAGVYQGFWALLDKGIYFVNPDTTPHAIINFFNFATGRTTKVAEVEKELELVYPSLAVSPDGLSLLYVQADSFESDIMLVEDFH
jgi:eukaryotic-like serine/threonine-protein kinase